VTVRAGAVHSDERLDVHPRAERRQPGTREDETRDARIEVHDDIPESGQVVGVQHVQLVGTVEGDPQMRPATFRCDISHMFLRSAAAAALEKPTARRIASGL
jgi:hypothetical protein